MTDSSDVCGWCSHVHADIGVEDACVRKVAADVIRDALTPLREEIKALKADMDRRGTGPTATEVAQMGPEAKAVILDGAEIHDAVRTAGPEQERTTEPVDDNIRTGASRGDVNELRSALEKMTEDRDRQARLKDKAFSDILAVRSDNAELRMDVSELVDWKKGFTERLRNAIGDLPDTDRLHDLIEDAQRPK